jgi:hypothetical protein
MKKTNMPFTRMQTRRSILPIACAGLLGLTLPVVAQSASEIEAIEPADQAEAAVPDGQLRFGLGLGGRMKSDIDNGGGVTGAESSETALRTTALGTYKISDEFKLGLAASFQWSRYDFSGVAGDPWQDVYLFRVTPLLQYTIDENWSVYGGPSMAFAGESGADFSDSTTGGGLVGFNYRASETLSIGAGFGIFSQIEDDARVVPFITANWMFADQWTLRAGFSEVAGNGGLGAEVTYDLGNNWKVGGGLQVTKKRFRLQDSGGSQGGVAEDTNVPIFAKVAWQPCEKATLEFVAGIAAGGEYRIEDNTGHKVYEENYDAAGLIGIRALFRF